MILVSATTPLWSQDGEGPPANPPTDNGGAGETLEVTHIRFNYDVANPAAPDDALGLRRDYSRDLDHNSDLAGEWIRSASRNEEALYVGKPTKTYAIEARFKLSQPRDAFIDIGAIARAGLIPDVSTKTVQFKNGESIDPADGDNYIRFQLSRPLEPKIDKLVDEWDWRRMPEGQMFDLTGPHTLFTIIGTPEPLWYNKTQLATRRSFPWISALEFAMDQAGLKSLVAPNDCLDKLRARLHDGLGYKYEAAQGAASYFSGTATPPTFNLTSFSSPTAGAQVNCDDMALGVATLASLVGVPTQYRRYQGAGHIELAQVIGQGFCNNPFFLNQANWVGAVPHPMVPAQFAYDTRPLSVQVISGKQTNLHERSYFGYHAAAVSGQSVHDACVGPHSGTESVYLGKLIDDDAPIKKAVTPSVAPGVWGRPTQVGVAAVKRLGPPGRLELR